MARAVNTTALMRLLCIALLIGCGGTPKKQAPPPPKDEVTDPVAEMPAEPAPEPPKPEPKVWHGKAVLTPVKGSKMKPAIVSFSRAEDADAASVSVDTFDGAKAGTYWLVVHEGEECGPNGTKAGGLWGPARTPLKVVIAKDLTGGLEADTANVALAGDDSIVGHVLVLHEDKKGKPGKAVGCGAIDVGDEG